MIYAYYCILYVMILRTRHKSQGNVFFASFGVQTLLITYKYLKLGSGTTHERRNTH